MRIDYRLEPELIGDYASVHARDGRRPTGPWGRLMDQLVRWSHADGPWDQAIELRDDGVVDCIRVDGEPRFFPWKEVREVWRAPAWIALRIVVADPDEDVEALVIPVAALPGGVEGVKTRYPRLAARPWRDVPEEGV